MAEKTSEPRLTARVIGRLTAPRIAHPIAPRRREWLRLFAVALLAFFIGVGSAIAQGKAGDRTWAQLSAEQQRILAPLAHEWDRLEPKYRTRWLGVAERYPKMEAAEQKRVQSRMEKWAKLTPEQRKTARENYQRFKEREDLVRKWEEYQSLAPHQRHSLMPEETGELPKQPRRRTPRTSESQPKGR